MCLYELQMFSGGGHKKPLHCVHSVRPWCYCPEQVSSVQDEHSGQAFLSSPRGEQYCWENLQIKINKSVGNISIRNLTLCDPYTN